MERSTAELSYVQRIPFNSGYSARQMAAYEEDAQYAAGSIEQLGLTVAFRDPWWNGFTVYDEDGTTIWGAIDQAHRCNPPTVITSLVRAEREWIQAR